MYYLIIIQIIIAVTIERQKGTYVTSRNKRYLMSNFENYEIFAIFKRELNKLSNDTRIIKIEALLLKV